jgi:hypothetical protein
LAHGGHVTEAAEVQLLQVDFVLGGPVM